jgi:predicted ATPase
MVYSFTGAQSTGKTTLLKMCREEYGSSLGYVDEVTRLVKRTYNVTINEDAGNITQLLILNQHLHNSMVIRPEDNVLMDRCIVDGIAYTKWLAENEGKISSWVSRYAIDLGAILLPKIDVIFHCIADFDLVDDGERSTSNSFREGVKSLIQTYTDQLRSRGMRVIDLSGSIENRMNTIKETIKLHEKR